MAKYRIIESRERQIVLAQIWRWWLPFWKDLKGYHSIYGTSRDDATRWCREAIDRHRRTGRAEEPE